MNHLYDDIAGRAASGPDRTAIVHGDTSYSYERLHQVVLDRQRQLGPNLGSGPVLVRVNRTLDTVVDVLALVGMGRSVALAAETAGEDALRLIAEDVGAAALLVSGECRILDRAGSVPSTQPPVLYFFTSGSTGRPKVVPIQTPAVRSFAGWGEAQFGLSTRRVLAFSPMNFDLSLLEIWSTLLHGGTVVLADAREATDAEMLLDLVHRESVDLVQGVPFVHTQIAEAAARRSGSPLTEVRDVIVTGSSIPQSVRADIAKAYPLAAFHNVYGSTETNDSFIAHLDPCDFAQLPHLPIGAPLPEVVAEVHDETGRILTGACRGELAVRTPYMMRGYVHRHLSTSPEANTGPWALASDGSTLFRTGDIVRRDAQNVYHLEGRTSRLVKRLGNRINLDHIEHAFRSHQHVRDCAALAVATEQCPDPDITVLVVPHQGVSPTTLALRMHASAALPGYAMPSKVTVLDRDLPRTATDKPDRARLTHLLEETRCPSR